MTAIRDRIRNLQQLLDLGSAEDLLRWAACQFAGRIALASSLGLEDQALTDMIARAGLPIPIFTLDTGRLFPETYDLLERTRLRYNIPVRVYLPDSAAVEEMVNRHGVNLFLDSVGLRKKCCQTRKIQPLNRALEGLDAWITGLRRGQSVTREQIEIIDWDQAHGLLKINPLAGWREDRVRAYIEAHHVPYNPLHDRGFPSIGCAGCTRPVKPGENLRSGRWWWEQPEHRECGLHLAAAAPSHSGEVER